MTNEEIRNTVLTICRDCDLEDLDPEIFDIFPEKFAQIGTFFIYDDCLYHGKICGSPSYWPIGKCNEITKILYRFYEEDRRIDFCFDFTDMLFVLTHNESRDCTLELIIGNKHIDNNAEIISILYERANKSDN